jgi:hypothetical protein
VENCKPIDISGPDCNLDEIRSALASYTSSAESLAHDSEREIAAYLADLTDAVEYRSDRGDYAALITTRCSTCTSGLRILLPQSLNCVTTHGRSSCRRGARLNRHFDSDDQPERGHATTTRKRIDDTAYNNMLLAFRDENFRLAAYKALMSGGAFLAAVRNEARNKVSMADIRNEAARAFFRERVSAGDHLSAEPLNEGAFRDGHQCRGETERAFNAAITAADEAETERLIVSRHSADKVDNAIRRAHFEFENNGWSVVIDSPGPYAWEMSSLSIELRPELGADFPAVLREMKKRTANGGIGLVIQGLSGAGTYETIRWVFRQNAAGIARMTEVTNAALALTEGAAP